MLKSFIQKFCVIVALTTTFVFSTIGTQVPGKSQDKIEPMIILEEVEEEVPAAA